MDTTVKHVNDMLQKYLNTIVNPLKYTTNTAFIIEEISGAGYLHIIREGVKRRREMEWTKLSKYNKGTVNI
jgi:hypothetical protein